MDIFLLIVACLLMVGGVIASFFSLPSVVVNYLGLVALHYTSYAHFSKKFLAFWGIVALASTLIDNLIPIYTTKRFGGTKRGMWGSFIGIVVGAFVFPPFGMVVGAFLGAMVGELTGGANNAVAIKSGMGALVGFLVGFVAKLMISLIMCYYFVLALIG